MERTWNKLSDPISVFHPYSAVCGKRVKKTLHDKNHQLHAVSRAQQGKQRETSVKTLHSPLSALF